MQCLVAETQTEADNIREEEEGVRQRGDRIQSSAPAGKTILLSKSCEYALAQGAIWINLSYLCQQRTCRNVLGLPWTVIVSILT